MRSPHPLHRASQVAERSAYSNGPQRLERTDPALRLQANRTTNSRFPTFRPCRDFRSYRSRRGRSREIDRTGCPGRASRAARSFASVAMLALRKFRCWLAIKLMSRSNVKFSCSCGRRVVLGYPGSVTAAAVGCNASWASASRDAEPRLRRSAHPHFVIGPTFGSMDPNGTCYVDQQPSPFPRGLFVELTHTRRADARRTVRAVELSKTVEGVIVETLDYARSVERANEVVVQGCKELLRSARARHKAEVPLPSRSNQSAREKGLETGRRVRTHSRFIWGTRTVGR